jgi:hypothetical protein
MMTSMHDIALIILITIMVFHEGNCKSKASFYCIPFRCEKNGYSQ